MMKKIISNFKSSLTSRAAIYAFKCFLFLRLFSSLVLLIAGLFAPAKVWPADPTTLSKLLELENQGTISRLLLAPWYRWDTIHYIEIADYGYSFNLLNSVWPPLYPLLTKLVSIIFTPTLLASLIVSNLSALIALLLLYLVVADSWDEKIARETVFSMTIFPTAFFLVAAYSESLFLALSLGCLYLYKKSKWWFASILGSAAVLTRLQAIFLMMPMLWILFDVFIIQKERKIRWLAHALAPMGAILLSLAGFVSYIRFGLNADWPWVTLSTHWSQHMGWPWEGILGNLTSLTLRPVSTPISPIAQVYDLLLVCGAIAVLMVSIKKIPPYYVIYTGFVILVILVKIDNAGLLVSASRYLLLAFPIMVAITVSLNKKLKYIWYGVSLGSQIMMLILFYWWVWIA
jgi:Gpi18-like mannosyltransferase